MGSLILLILFFFVSYLFCAVDISSFDLEVRHYSAFGGEKGAYVRDSAQLFVADSAGCRQSIYAVLSDQILRGFQFLPKIDPSKGGVGLLLPGVRRYICSKEEFFSDEIRLALQAVEAFLCRDVHLSARRGCEHLLKDIYPEGKDRRWSVVDRKDVRPRMLVDCVYVTLSREGDALCGILCNKRSAQVPKKPDLLDFKRELALSGDLEVAKKSGALAGRSWALESLASGCGVGVVCCGPDGVQKSALYDVRGGVDISQELPSIGYKMGVPAFESFRILTLSGYVLKYPVLEASSRMSSA